MKFVFTILTMYKEIWGKKGLTLKIKKKKVRKEKSVGLAVEYNDTQRNFRLFEF